MRALTRDQADQVVDQSLANFLPQATELTHSDFCSECQNRCGGGFPCRTAQVMIRVYLSALVAKQARLN